MTRTLPILTLAAASLLSGCSDNDSNAITPDPQAPQMATFEVTVINLTAAQPMSPVAAYLHNGTASGWRFGQPASVELEQLAEAGDGSGWLSLANDNGALATASGDGILMPGASQTLSLTLETGNTLMLTSATMLVNTNDAFAGINGWNLTDLAVGDSMTMTLPVYDAGTEANSELPATIPGPAGGGAGFDSSRDDVNFIARHPGVVGNQDGAADSALDGRHTFDAPVARLTVMRSQ